MPQPSLARTYLLILLTTIIWGGTAVAGKLVIQDVPPITAGLFRYGVTAGLLMLLFRSRLPGPRSLRRRERWTLLWVGIFGTFLNHLCFFLALRYAPATHGAIIPSTTSPLWTMLLAARRGRERIAFSQAVGLILCLVGVVLVVRPERLLAESGRSVLFGDFLFLLGGCAWGVYSYLSAVTMQRLSAVCTLAYGMAIGTALLVPVAALERPWSTLRVAHASAWGALAFLILACTLLAFLWWNVALSRVGAGQTAIFTNLVPVFGVLLAWMILGERLAPIQLVGGFLAMAGVVACQRPGALLLRIRMAPAWPLAAWKRQRHDGPPSS